MFLRNVKSEMGLPACDYSSEKFSVIGYCDKDISPIMPYLNATQPKALYQHGPHILRFRFEGHPVTLRANEIAIGSIIDNNQAIEVLTRLQKLINETWEQRHEIAATTVERKRLKAMDIFQLLPGTNCRECGEPTCFIFAGKLTTHQVDLERCKPLSTIPDYGKNREALIKMIELAI